MIVIKLGGTVYKNIDNICKDVAKLDEEVIIVHGGGKEVTGIAENLGKKQKFIVSPEGIRSRYTDKETMEIFQMVMAGKINKDIVLALDKHGKNAIGICGIDNSFIRASRKKLLKSVEGDKVKLIEGGYTGKIIEIDKEFIVRLMSGGLVPVIASIGVSENYESLNIDADTLASSIASKLKADTLLLLTDQNGVLDEKKETIPEITKDKLKNFQKGIGYGMNRKVTMCFEAIDNGVKKIVIANGLIENAVENAFVGRLCTVIR